MKKNNQVSKAVLNAVKKQRALRAQIELLQREYASSQAIIREATEKNGGEIIHPEFRAQIIEASRDVFSLQEARKALGDKVLKPFTKTTSYTMLRVN